ncbi:MAG: hypothetical protein EAZ92_02475, partial [Candidatus Kapaibacterium sp.]
PYGSTGTIQDSLLGSQLIHGYEKHQNTIKMVLLAFSAFSHIHFFATGTGEISTPTLPKSEEA